MARAKSLTTASFTPLKPAQIRALPARLLTWYDRHRRVLQADRAMAHGDERFAGNLEVALAHGHARFLVHAADVFRHLVVAVIDHRLMQGAKARGAIGRGVFDVQRLHDIEHFANELRV